MDQRETCKNCGAVYEVTWRKITFRDKDYENCECGEVLLSWNGSAIPSFEKIKAGTK